MKSNRKAVFFLTLTIGVCTLLLVSPSTITVASSADARNSQPVADASTSSGRSFEQVARLAASRKRTAFFGGAVAISGDTAVVGALGFVNPHGRSIQGFAYVFVKPATGWANMTETAQLRASDGGDKATNAFGNSVAIDGDTIIVGAVNGEVYVYVKPATGWVDMTETAKLQNGGRGADCFACAVGISDDTVVVGAPGLFHPFAPGKAYVFVKPAGGWQTTSTPNAILTPTDKVPGGQFGGAVAIDRDTIAVLAPHAFSTTDPSGAYVYVKPSGGWQSATETAKLSDSHGVKTQFFGLCIAGNTVVAGGFTGGPPGVADVFVKPASGWANAFESASLTGGNTFDDFGDSVSLNGKGLMVGAPAANQIQGAAYLFVEPAGGWKSTSKFSAVFTSLGGRTDDLFGLALGLQDKTVLIGAPNAHRTGLAYIFEP